MLKFSVIRSKQVLFSIYNVDLPGKKTCDNIVLSISMGFYALFTKIYSKNR